MDCDSRSEEQESSHEWGHSLFEVCLGVHDWLLTRLWEEHQFNPTVPEPHALLPL
jgi:hypothetical protein